MKILTKIFLIAVCSLLFLHRSVGQTIQPGTSLRISISGVPQSEMTRFNGTAYPVSGDGMINMPFIGNVRAARLSGAQLAAALQEIYKQRGIYTNPTFQVITDSVSGDIAQLSVTVGGQVSRPGPIAYRQGLKLWEAVQAAGGATPFGALNRIRLSRGGESKQYNLNNDHSKNILLQPNDTIEVPQKGIFGR